MNLNCCTEQVLQDFPRGTILDWQSVVKENKPIFIVFNCCDSV